MSRWKMESTGPILLPKAYIYSALALLTAPCICRVHPCLSLPPDLPPPTSPPLQQPTHPRSFPPLPPHSATQPLNTLNKVLTRFFSDTGSRFR